MDRIDFEKLVDKLGSVNLSTGGGKKFPSKEEIVEITNSLQGAIIQRTLVQTLPKKNTQVDLPELKEAILKVIYLYCINDWLIDGDLFALLLWTLHSGSKSRRSQQRDKNKYYLAATMEAVWLHKYTRKISALKLSKSIGVSRTTIARWRKEAEYLTLTNIDIQNKDFIDEVIKHIK